MSYIPVDKEMSYLVELILIGVFVCCSVLIFRITVRSKGKIWAFAFASIAALLMLDLVNTYAMFSSLAEIRSFDSMQGEDLHYAIQHSSMERLVGDSVGFELYYEISFKPYLSFRKDLASNYDFLGKFYTEYVVWVETKPLKSFQSK